MRPATRSAWPSYASIAAVGYVVYGVGAVGPYLREDLGLSATLVGLHTTGLAIGTVLAGAVVPALDRRFGEPRVRAAAMLVIVLAVIVLAAAPAVVATLTATVALGIGAGAILGYANAHLAAPGGVVARLRVARANVWAMVAAFLCPVILAFGASSGPGWWLGLAPAPILLALLVPELRTQAAEPAAVAGSSADGGRLPGRFWLAWAYLVAVVAVEFSIVVWAATLVAARTGVALPDATLVGSLFLAGMFAGRLALSAGLGAGRDVRVTAAASLVLAGAGAVVTWLAPLPLVAGVGLFLAGCGVASLYPLGIAAALGATPGRMAAAGTRLTSASGLAILGAPLGLGALADAVGVVTGWWLVVGLAAVGVGLAFQLPQERAAAYSRAARHAGE